MEGFEFVGCSSCKFGRCFVNYQNTRQFYVHTHKCIQFAFRIPSTKPMHNS